MKTYLKTWLIGGYYQYHVFKVVDGAGRVYYLAEPCGKGVTRYSETVDELQHILETDAKIINQMHQRIL